MPLASFTLAFFLAVELPQDPPLVSKTSSGRMVVLGERLATGQAYRAEFQKGPFEAPLAIRVERAVEPEPYEIIHSDEGSATVVVKTTTRGAFKLGQHALKVSPKSPPLPNCTRAMAYLDLDPGDNQPAEPDVIFAKDSPCPGATDVSPQQSLVLEGLSKSGKRLWAIAVPDPRWRHAEAIGAKGDFELVFAGQLPEPVLYASFAAPITPELRRIAWHEIRKDGSVRKIGERDWRVAAKE